MHTTDPNPSEARKKAGNYRKKKIRWNGLRISIENPAGTMRSGTDRKGKKWQSYMPHDYGYIAGTKGRDGDHVDVFVGPHPKSELVTIINQIDPKTGKFDEHKCMLGFFTKQEAIDAYHQAYMKGWKGMGSAATMGLDQFKKWVRSGRKMGPVQFSIHEFAKKNVYSEGYKTPAVAKVKMPAPATGGFLNHESAKKHIGPDTKGIGRSARQRAYNGGLILENSALDTLPGSRPDPAFDHVRRNAEKGWGGLDRYRKSMRRHEIAHSVIQHRRGGPPKSIAGLAGEEVKAYSASNSGKKLPKGMKAGLARFSNAAGGVATSTLKGRRSLGIPAWKLFRARIDITHLTMKGRTRQFNALPVKEERKHRSTQTAINTVGVLGSLGLGYYGLRQGNQMKAEADGIMRDAQKTAKNAAYVSGEARDAVRTAKASRYLAGKRLRHSASPKNWTTGKLANRLLKGATRGRMKLFRSRYGQIHNFRAYQDWDGTTGINPETGKFEDNRSTARKALPSIIGSGLAAGAGLALLYRGRSKTPFPKGLHPLAGSPFESGAAREVRETAVKKAMKRKATKKATRRKRPPVNGGTAGSRNLKARLGKVTEFNLRNPEYDNQYTASLDPRSAYRKAQTTRRWANRAGEVGRDLDDIVSGRPRNPKKKRFYEKSWFQNGLTAAAIASPIIASRQLARTRKAIPALNKLGKVGRGINKSHKDGFPLFSARTRRVIHFSTYADTYETRAQGWDLRDGRGKSARVFAPGSKPRQRRPKEPHERVENIRKRKNQALGLAALGVGFGIAGMATNPRIASRLLRSKIRKKGAGNLRVVSNAKTA